MSGIVESFCLLREAVSAQIKVRCGNRCLLWGFQRFRDTGSIGSGVRGGFRGPGGSRCFERAGVVVAEPCQAQQEEEKRQDEEIQGLKRELEALGATLSLRGTSCDMTSHDIS